MSKVIFIFEGQRVEIQCKNEDRMRDICIKLAIKIDKNINNLYFLYDGKMINLELKYKEKNKDIQRKKHEIELNKIQESEIRHNKNVLNEKEKFDKKVHENHEKLMKKYVTFYWSRKHREELKKEKFLHFNEKYDEKFGRLEQIEKNTEKKRKNLIKKLQIIEANQNQLKEKDKLKFESIKEKREK